MVINRIKKTFRFISLVSLFLLLTACPEETFCDLEAPVIELPGLAVFAPEKRIFNSGEEIKISMSVPSKITNNGNFYDIYMSLGIDSSNMYNNLNEILDGNTFTVSKGRLENGQIILVYDSELDNYEFECDIVLERTGVYRQLGIKETFAFARDFDKCDFIAITTNIKGINEEGFYEFSVE